MPFYSSLFIIWLIRIIQTFSSSFLNFLVRLWFPCVNFPSWISLLRHIGGKVLVSLMDHWRTDCFGSEFTHFSCERLAVLLLLRVVLCTKQICFKYCKRVALPASQSLTGYWRQNSQNKWIGADFPSQVPAFLLRTVCKISTSSGGKGV